MKNSLYIERAMFVVGNPGDGKSTQLRSIFVDYRFGFNGVIPSKKIREVYWLSHNRGLYLRLTSPHEYEESPKEFFEKIRRKAQNGRWVVVSPLQLEPRNKMPGLVESVELFVSEFDPERVRICFLSPNRSGDSDPAKLRKMIKSLWEIDRSIECIVLDATTKKRNGLIFADFLDYS